MSGGGRSVVIVGASAAGLRCACRLARLRPDWTIRVVEARNVFSYAACGLPYVLSGDIPDGDEVRKTSFGVVRDGEYFRSFKGVEVLTGRRAVGIGDHTLVVEGDGGRTEMVWDELVLATGARPRRLPGQPEHARIRSFHTWEDVAHLHQGLVRGGIGTAAVVGAGLVGCELAEAFGSLWGAEVTVIEAAPQPLPAAVGPEVAACVAHELTAQGVRLLTGSPVEAFLPDDDGVTVVAGGEEVRADVAVVAVGVEPVVEPAASAGVELGPTGAIAVSDRFATSRAHVWAVGDCVEVRHAVTGEAAYLPLGSLANRQGRTLANILAGREDSFPPVAGAMAVKVFDLNVASVGMTVDEARRRGIDARCAWITTDSCAHYWPESQDLHLCLVYEGERRRVLGVQGAGRGEVVKRIDVAAQLIVRGATLAQLTQLEHAYAPPYAPAIDPLAVAAFAAENQEDGVAAATPLTVPRKVSLLDVRLPEESAERPVAAPGVRVLPLAELREAVAELDQARWLVLCERGTRSAEAVRVLVNGGRQAEYLGGGLLWRWEAGLRGAG